ncbi:hypothetical protein E4T43_00345 [Aureobasidium subglaciale]|nr:hypothetical protein E4T43_00345 [Aureobasidium subglaciale]
MYSQDETVHAVLAFYQQIIKHPYLNDQALIVPPASGWESEEIDVLKDSGKSDVVVELARHLPYLGSVNHDDRILLHYETCAICYAGGTPSWMDEVYPVPSHCLYLTQGVDREGYSLILDTEKGELYSGTVTAFSIMQYSLNSNLPWDKLEAIPETEQWKCHFTLPVKEFFDNWIRRYENLVFMLTSDPINGPTSGAFHSRVIRPKDEEELEAHGLIEWHPDLSDQPVHLHAGSLVTAEIYKTYLDHGWPSNFDKDSCRRKVLRLLRKEYKRMFREMEGDDPRPRSEDETTPPPQVRKATGGPPPRKKLKTEEENDVHRAPTP